MCVSPKIVNGQVFPCGKCVECINKRIKAWATRIYLHSLKYQNQCMFLTLTYDPKYLPANGLLCKRDYQCFLKRLRKYYNNSKISYFVCGEYGDRFGRPHYHFILFGISPTKDNYTAIEKIWNRGFIKIEKVNMKTCRYVAKYCCKSRQKEKVDPVTGEIMAEFVQMSKRPAISKEWFLENFFMLYCKRSDEPCLLKIGKYFYSYPPVFRKWFYSITKTDSLVNISDTLIVPNDSTNNYIDDLVNILQYRGDLSEKYEVIKASQYLDILKSNYAKQRQLMFSRGCDMSKDDKKYRKYQDYYYYYTRDRYLVIHNYDNVRLGFVETNIKDLKNV